MFVGDTKWSVECGGGDTHKYKIDYWRHQGGLPVGLPDRLTGHRGTSREIQKVGLKRGSEGWPKRELRKT